MVLAVDPINSQVIYTNGDDGPLFRSVDAGQTWTHIATEDPVGGYFDATGAFVLVGDRGVYRWPGPGNLFAFRQGNLQITELYTLGLDSSSQGIAYGVAQDQFHAMKYNGSVAWNKVGGDFEQEVGKIRVSSINPSRLFDFDPEDSESFI